MNNIINELTNDYSSSLFSYNQLPWYSRCLKVGSFRSGILQKVQNSFQSLLNLTHDAMGNVWNQAVRTKRIQWDSKTPLTPHVLQDIESALRSTLVYHGKGCQMDWKASSNPEVHGLIAHLLGKDEFSRDWLTMPVIKNVLIKKNPEILHCVRTELRNILETCSNQLPKVGTPQEALFKTFVGNCIALLPYGYPEAGEEYQIPQKIDGQWKVCNYIMDTPIELSPKSFLTPVLAFGLTSTDGPPLLTIIGTTYPSGDGFLATLLSDVTPFMSVGHAPYLLGQKNIEAWLENKSQVRLFGLSLGGSICFHVLRNNREKIAEVEAYNPAGLYPWDWRGKFDEQKVNIYYQQNDIVPSMGMFPTGSGVTILRLFRPNGERGFKAHARAYAGGAETTIIKSSPEYENSRICRKLLIIAHLLASPFAGLAGAYFLMLAYVYARCKNMMSKFY